MENCIDAWGSRYQYYKLMLAYIGGLQADNHISDSEKLEILAKSYVPFSTLLEDLEIEDKTDEEEENDEI